MSDFLYREIKFNKDGTLQRATDPDKILTFLEKEQIADLIVISHGWNNDMREATDLYTRMITHLQREVGNQPGLANRKFGVLGVLWPSKKFTDSDLRVDGGAVSITSSAGGTGEIAKMLTELGKEFVDAKSKVAVAQLKKDVKRLQDSSSSFVKNVGTLLKKVKSKKPEPGDSVDSVVNEQDAEALLTRISNPTRTVLPGSGGGATSMSSVTTDVGGGAAEFGGNLLDGARNLLNYFTYYQMKERAGVVGQKGLAPVLTKIRKKRPAVRLHLIGHSFGGRLVASATASLPVTVKIDTLVLLQAAFSHYGFAKNYQPGKDGLFRTVIDGNKVSGAFIISHTQNDEAVGKAYAIASRIAKQVASALGDANDEYGGIGANGAQHTTEASNDFKLTATTRYGFRKTGMYNLLADSCISDHSDIARPEVARAIVSAIQV